MPNTSSAKKAARQNIKRRSANLARRTAVKTAVKKVLTALETNKDIEAAKTLLKNAEAELARAKSKGLVHANTAARKVSRLAKRINAAAKPA